MRAGPRFHRPRHSVPLVTAGRHEQRAFDAVRFISGRIMLARANAARRGAAVGIRFTSGAVTHGRHVRVDGVRFRSYVDANGTGGTEV